DLQPQDDRQQQEAAKGTALAKDDAAHLERGHAHAAGKAAPTSADGMVVQPHGAGSDVGIQEQLDDEVANAPARDTTDKRTTSIGAGSASGVATCGSPAPPSVNGAEPKVADPQLVEWAQGAHQRLIQLVA